jgi:ribosome-associated protein
MIRVNNRISIGENEIEEEFIRASGPGGQNVNKVASAVQIRFDAARSASLPDDVRKRLISIAGDKITGDGILIIDARRFRSQKANREDAVNRLVEMIRKAAVKPRLRFKTRPTASSRLKTMETKQHRARIKKLRRRVSADE